MPHEHRQLSCIYSHHRQILRESAAAHKRIMRYSEENCFSLTDPNDRSILNAVAFDTCIPAVMSDFVRAA